MLDNLRRTDNWQTTSAVSPSWGKRLAETAEWVRAWVERQAINVAAHFDALSDGGLSSVSNDRRVRVPVTPARLQSSPPPEADRFDRF